jgi:hypothetical protein
MNKFEAIARQREQVVDDLREAQQRVTSCEEHLEHLDWATRHAWSEQSISADGSPTYCSRCGADVSTERLFSLHFEIPDWRYYNLGHCPERG